ncbi:MAG: hypothetical protein QOD71_3009 [Thermoleophilaceae bacterium]|nr:hypothetical protein [Thermoleophilaceae bacterium]
MIPASSLKIGIYADHDESEKRVTGPWAESTNGLHGFSRLNGCLNAVRRGGYRSGLHRVPTALLIVVFLTLAGCGGGSDSKPDAFAQGYNETIRRLASVNQELAALDVSAKSSRGIAREFDQFGEALESTRSELARLQPPNSALKQFNALLGALDHSVSASRRAAAAARAVRPGLQRRALRELMRATHDVDAAQDALGRAVATG